MKKAVKDAILARLRDGCVLLIARTRFACAGDGNLDEKLRKSSEVCYRILSPQCKYIELAPQPHGARTRHCIPCAEVYLAREWEEGLEVRVKKGVSPYGGERGKLVSHGKRPDDRTFWEVYLYLSRGHSTPATREYYEEELELVR